MLPVYQPVKKQVVKVEGLAAVPTGTADVQVAVFAGADVNEAVNAASLPLAEWYSRTDVLATGTLIRILRPGIFAVTFVVACSGANRIQFGILRGSAAPPVDPEWSDNDIVASGDYFGVAGELKTYTITAQLVITVGDVESLARNQLRFMIGNGAGAAPAAAGLVLASCGYRIAKIGNVQSVS